MGEVEDIVIVGAGIAGLATALGLHRLGMRSLVLESSDHLRSSGFALTVWSNAWRALHVLGVADSLRQHHVRLQGHLLSALMEYIDRLHQRIHREDLDFNDKRGVNSSEIQQVVVASAISGDSTAQVPIKAQTRSVGPEVRSVRRNLLLEALASDLPEGTIRFNAKVVLIEEHENLKLVHMADRSTLTTKVLVGCDGVNSVVARWLGLRRPAYAGWSEARAITEFPDGHGFKPNFLQCMGHGFRSGFMPCDDKHIYWFFTYSPSAKEKEMEDDMTKMKQYILSKLQKVPGEVIRAVERTDTSSILVSHLRLRWPCELLWGVICKGNVCLAGDALHAMTPDLGQGGGSALEDGVTLARCLGEVFLGKPGGGGGEEHERIKAGLKKYTRERKWRSLELVCIAYVLGLVQRSDGAVMNFLRDKLLASLMAKTMVRIAGFDCGFFLLLIDANS